MGSELLQEKKAVLVIIVHGLCDLLLPALQSPLLNSEQVFLGIHVAVLAIGREAELAAQHAVRPHVASWTPAQHEANIHLHDCFPVPPGVLEGQRQAVLAEERVKQRWPVDVAVGLHETPFAETHGQVTDFMPIVQQGLTGQTLRLLLRELPQDACRHLVRDLLVWHGLDGDCHFQVGLPRGLICRGPGGPCEGRKWGRKTAHWSGLPIWQTPLQRLVRAPFLAQKMGPISRIARPEPSQKHVPTETPTAQKKMNMGVFLFQNVDGHKAF